MEIVKRISAPMADGRITNGYEVTVPVLEVAAPRLDHLPVGARINLVTKG